MAERVNRKIIDKIKKSESNEEVKRFLVATLLFELRNFEIGRERYSKEYERNIRKYVSTYGAGN